MAQLCTHSTHIFIDVDFVYFVQEGSSVNFIFQIKEHQRMVSRPVLMHGGEYLSDGGMLDHASSFSNALAALRAEYDKVVLENIHLRSKSIDTEKSAHSAPPFGPMSSLSPGVPALQVDSVSGEALDGEQSVPLEAAGNGVRVSLTTLQSKNTNTSKSSNTEHHLPRRQNSVFPQIDTVRQSIAIAMERRKSYTRESTCKCIASHPWFQSVDMAMIGIYAVWMGIDADWNTAMLITESKAIFQTADQLFCIYFVIELGIRYFAFETCRDRIRDPWFVLDSILVPLTLFDTWAMTIIALVTDVDQQDATAVRRSEIIRLFRTLRLTRICHVAKLVKFMPELQILIKAMLVAFRSVFFALMLLLASHYTLAIAFHVTLQGQQVGNELFGSVLASMQTLFVHCTLMDEVFQLVDPLVKEDLFLHVICVYLVMFLNAITLMNILIGIVVEVISTVAAAERASVNVKWVHEVIDQFWGDAQRMGQNELKILLRGNQAMGALKLVGVDADILMETIDDCFKDSRAARAGMEPEIAHGEFVDLVLGLRGSNTATVKDVVELRRVFRRTQKVMAKHLDVLFQQLKQETLCEM